MTWRLVWVCLFTLYFLWCFRGCVTVQQSLAVLETLQEPNPFWKSSRPSCRGETAQHLKTSVESVAHNTDLLLRSNYMKKSLTTETTMCTCRLVQSHRTNVETEQEPIDNHIHHECCHKDPVIVAQCCRTQLQWRHTKNIQRRNIITIWHVFGVKLQWEICCSATVLSTRSGGQDNLLFNVVWWW